VHRQSLCGLARLVYRIAAGDRLKSDSRNIRQCKNAAQRQLIPVSECRLHAPARAHVSPQPSMHTQ
jgi:hypothetical protein